MLILGRQVTSREEFQARVATEAYMEWSFYGKDDEVQNWLDAEAWVAEHYLAEPDGFRDLVAARAHRTWLFDEARRARMDWFEAERRLNRRGTNPAANEAVRQLARQIFEERREADAQTDWLRAESYCRQALSNEDRFRRD